MSRARKTFGARKGPAMPCGWGCGALLSAREMRQHFARCPMRPGVPHKPPRSLP